MNRDDFLDAASETKGKRMPRRKLLQGLGSGALTLLAAPVGVGMIDPPSAGAAPNVNACLDAIDRSYEQYARACERAFQEDLAAVEADHQIRLASFSEADGDETAYRARCDHEREALLERVHASRRSGIESGARRRAELLRNCGINEH
jgi:hypothetical protein